MTSIQQARPIRPVSRPTPAYRAPAPTTKYKARDAKVAILGFWLIVAIVVVIVVIANATRSSPSNADASYISAHRQDFQTITSGVATIETEIGLIGTPEQERIDEIASTADQLHASFDQVHSDLLSSDSSNGVVDVWTASGELRDAMANLVTYTGKPNPETLAHFTTLFQQAVTDWNQGVDELWSSAKEKDPPNLTVGD